MKNKIKDLIISMSLRPEMFASNKESFAFQIYTMLYLLDKISTHEEKIDFFKTANLINGSSFINCNDQFEDEWAKKVTEYALSIIG